MTFTNRLTNRLTGLASPRSGEVRLRDLRQTPSGIGAFALALVAFAGLGVATALGNVVAIVAFTIGGLTFLSKADHRLREVGA